MKIPTLLVGETIVVKSVKPKVVLRSDGGATVTVSAMQGAAPGRRLAAQPVI